MNEVVDPLHGIPVSFCLSYRPLILFSKVLLPPCNGHYAFEPWVRRTFRTIPQSIKLKIIKYTAIFII